MEQQEMEWHEGPYDSRHMVGQVNSMDPSDPVSTVDPFGVAAQAQKAQLEKPEWKKQQEAIERLNRELDALTADYKQRCAPVAAKIHAQQEHLKIICPHPEDKVERRHHTSPGGYYDRTEYTSWLQCTVCGAESEKKTTYGATIDRS